MATESRRNEIHPGQTWVRNIINNGSAVTASATYSFVAGLPIQILQTTMLGSITQRERFYPTMVKICKDIRENRRSIFMKNFYRAAREQMLTQSGRGVAKAGIFFNLTWFEDFFGNYAQPAIITAYVAVDAIVHPFTTRIVCRIENKEMPKTLRDHYKGIGALSFRTALTCLIYLQLKGPSDRFTAWLGFKPDSVSGSVVTTVPISIGITSFTQPLTVVGILQQSAEDKQPSVAENRHSFFKQQIEWMMRKKQFATSFIQKEGLRAMWRGGLSNIGITYILALNTTLLIYYGQKEDNNEPILGGEDPKPYLPL